MLDNFLHKIRSKDILEYINLESNNSSNYIKITQSHKQFAKNTCNLEIGCYCLNELCKEVDTEDIIQAIRSYFVNDILPKNLLEEDKKNLKKAFKIK